MAALRPLIIAALLTAHSLYGSVPAALKNEQLCGKVASTFDAAALPGCVRSVCAKAPQINGSVCACLKDEDTGKTVLSIIGTDGSTRATQATEVMPPTFEPSSFRLEVGNYEGDGSPQLLLAVMNARGNGMAIEAWSVMRVSQANFAKALDIADYGVMSFTTAATTSGRCRVFGSTWTNGWDPKRGDGKYVAGRWYDLETDDAKATRQRPVIYHRYLYSVEKSRNQSKSKAAPTPVHWYKFPEASMVIGPDPIP